jgi:hypothetical protein
MTGLNTAAMQWGSQYNGIAYDPSLFNGEGTEYQPYKYMDVSAGVAYWYSKNDKAVIHKAPSDAKIGLSVFHINKPFYTFDPKGNSKLPRRVVLHASALFATQTTNLYWYPNFNLMLQANNTKFILDHFGNTIFNQLQKVPDFKPRFHSPVD